MAEHRRARRARHQGLAQLFEQDLVLWFASVGAVALVLAGLLRIAAMPIWPREVRTAALVLLMVTLAITVFLMAASAPNMRGWFRAEAARRGTWAERMESSSHAEATELLRGAESGEGTRAAILVLQSADPLDALAPPAAPPTGVGFLPRAGAVSVGPRSRHDPFPEARVQGSVEAVGEPLPQGVLHGLQLFEADDSRLVDMLPEGASPVGLAALDAVERWPTEAAPWPRVELLSVHRDMVLAELLEHVRGVILELSRVDEQSSRQLTDLGHLGSRLLVVVPAGFGRTKTGGPLPRLEGVLVVERGRTSLARGVRRWWSGLNA